MEPLKRQYRESIIALSHALETARRFLNHDSPEVHETIRRIARCLWAAGSTYRVEEIAREASWLEKADTVEIPVLLENLDRTFSELTTGAGHDKLTVLVVEDDPNARKILKNLLTLPGREIRFVEGAAEALANLMDREISLVILDLNLPGGDGRDFLLQLRSFPGTSLLPVIVLTANDQAQVEAECLALGADLFLRKPYDPELLAVAVAGRLQRSADIARQARQDLLTGLPNRSALEEIFARAASFAARRREPLSLSIMDLDRFKSVNDTFGHAVGDEVLRRTATVLARSLRRSDQIGRWGGEEFVVIFPHTGVHGAKIAMEKALAALRQETFTTPLGKTFQVTFSAGIAEVAPGMLVQEAVAEADRLLYIAKAQGRNRVLNALDAPPAA